MINQREETSTNFFVVTLHSSKQNETLLDKNGILRDDIRRNIDYSIVPSTVWEECKSNYDIEIQIKDVYNVFISFSCNGLSYKNIYVHGVEKVFDVIQTLFVNKAFTIESFNQMFVVRCDVKTIDPMVNFNHFDNTKKDIVLIVERRTKRADEQLRVSETSKIYEHEIYRLYEKSIHQPFQGNQYYKAVDGSDSDIQKSLNFYRSIYTQHFGSKMNVGKAASVTELDKYDWNAEKHLIYKEIDVLNKFKNERCAGIVNIGNSCYMNTSIQCLNNCTLFSNFFIFFRDILKNGEQTHPPFVQVEKNKKYKENSQIISDLADVFTECRGDTLISPRALKQAISKKNTAFDNTKEQDAAEFIESILTYIHDGLCYNSISKTVNLDADAPITNEQGFLETDMKPEFNYEFDKLINSEKSIVSKLFYNMYRNTMQCNTCGLQKHKDDLMMMLPLSIPNKISYHSSSTLIMLGPSRPIKVLIPLNFTMQEALEYTKIEYDTTSKLLPVEYANGYPIEVIPSQKSISSIKNDIFIYEFNTTRRYYFFQLYYTKFMFIKRKIPFSFILEEDQMKTKLYEKLKIYFIKSITPADFFTKITIKRSDFVAPLNIPAIDVTFHDIKELFGENFPLLTVSYSKKKDDVSLKDCLNYCFKEETLEINCENCKKQRLFTMRPKMAALSKYLMIHLKRFSYSGNKAKINTFIDFPERNLKIEGNDFNLIATANHLEIGLGYGHYIAYLRKDNIWYCCNDSVISVAPELDKSTAYILFYEKVR
ncbi:Ubiquitin carboxyl-terminal hydrolase 15 [Glugoides intestinalis]